MIFSLAVTDLINVISLDFIGFVLFIQCSNCSPLWLSVSFFFFFFCSYLNFVNNWRRCQEATKSTQFSKGSTDCTEVIWLYDMFLSAESLFPHFL